MGRKPYEYTECRTVGHAWTSIEMEKSPSFGMAIDFFCTRCTTHRRDVISQHTGELLSRYYRHPEEYKFEGKMTRQEWRKMYVRRIKHYISAREGER